MIRKLERRLKVVTRHLAAVVANCVAHEVDRILETRRLLHKHRPLTLRLGSTYSPTVSSWLSYGLFDNETGKWISGLRVCADCGVVYYHSVPPQ